MVHFYIIGNVSKRSVEIWATLCFKVDEVDFFLNPYSNNQQPHDHLSNSEPCKWSKFVPTKYRNAIKDIETIKPSKFYFPKSF